MREVCIWLGLVVAAIGGIVMACQTEVPRPEARRSAIVPPNHVIETRAQFGATPATPGNKHAPVDAGVDVLDLPPNPDADVVRDAATPL